jgi:hypothetical protein
MKSAANPTRRPTPEPPACLPRIPPRAPGEVGGGEAHFMANWRWFLQWNLQLDPAVVQKKLDAKQQSSANPAFDCYRLYKAMVTRGGAVQLLHPSS